ncbi:MAG: RES family NAD+ phosphorylase [Candidatus Neomarinimicrobiota bacterium]
MIRLFRIARTAYIDDLTGEGARLYGGRWSRKGDAVLYTSERRSLAAMEYLVHLPPGLAPPNLSIREFELPDDVSSLDVPVTTLPPDWKTYPPLDITMKFGTDWLQAGDSLLLRVPSVNVEKESNVLINPSHPEFKQVNALAPQPFAFDPRLVVPR